MKATVTITLHIPDDFSGVGGWNRDQSLRSFVGHWLEEGYYTGNGYVELPAGIDYGGFEIDITDNNEPNYHE